MADNKELESSKILEILKAQAAQEERDGKIKYEEEVRRKNGGFDVRAGEKGVNEGIGKDNAPRRAQNLPASDLSRSKPGTNIRTSILREPGTPKDPQKGIPPQPRRSGRRDFLIAAAGTAFLAVVQTTCDPLGLRRNPQVPIVYDTTPFPEETSVPTKLPDPTKPARAVATPTLTDERLLEQHTQIFEKHRKDLENQGIDVQLLDTIAQTNYSPVTEADKANEKAKKENKPLPFPDPDKMPNPLSASNTLKKVLYTDFGISEMESHAKTFQQAQNMLDQDPNLLKHLLKVNIDKDTLGHTNGGLFFLVGNRSDLQNPEGYTAWISLGYGNRDSWLGSELGELSATKIKEYNRKWAAYAVKAQIEKTKTPSPLPTPTVKK